MKSFVELCLLGNETNFGFEACVEAAVLQFLGALQGSKPRPSAAVSEWGLQSFPLHEEQPLQQNLSSNIKPKSAAAEKHTALDQILLKTVAVGNFEEHKHIPIEKSIYHFTV